MADTVMPASKKILKDLAASDHILERLEALADQYAEECKPKPWLYVIKDEEEAEQLLVAMAAVIKITVQDVHNALDRRTYLDVAAGYRKAVLQGKALQCFREMTEDDQLELWGLTLTAGRIVLA